MKYLYRLILLPPLGLIITIGLMLNANVPSWLDVFADYIEEKCEL